MESNDGYVTVTKHKLIKKQSNDSENFTKRFHQDKPQISDDLKKRILCKNMITTGKCPYGSSCDLRIV